MSIAAPISLARPLALARFAAPAAFAAVLLGSLALHVAFGTVGDVSWLITVDEKWFSGATPYRDIVEINPPASLLLYWPAFALAKFLRIAPEFTVAAFGYLCALGSLAFAARLAFPRAADIKPPLPLFALAAALLLPGHAFDERDVLAAFMALPFIALCAARLEGRAPSLGAATLAGLLMGATIAIKPPYALIPLALAPLMALRLRAGALATAPEALAAAAVAALYAAGVAVFFPAYISDVLPIGIAIYAPIRESLFRLATSAEMLPAALMLASVFLRPVKRGAKTAALALAALGAFLAFLAQGKGWAYQAYPAVFFAALLGALALQDAKPSPRALAVFAAPGLALAALAVATGAAPTPLAVLAALGLHWLAPRLGFAEPPAEAFGVKLPISTNALYAAAFGAACGIFAVEGVHDAGLTAMLSKVGPHPRVIAISESLGFGHPLVRAVGGDWVQSTPGLWITAGALRLIENAHGDPAVAARLNPYIDADRDRLVADIAREKPDVLLVGKLGTPFHEWAWADAKITAARQGYVLYARNADKDWPAEIYVRRDMIAVSP